MSPLSMPLAIFILSGAYSSTHHCLLAAHTLLLVRGLPQQGRGAAEESWDKAFKLTQRC